MRSAVLVSVMLVSLFSVSAVQGYSLFVWLDSGQKQKGSYWYQIVTTVYGDPTWFSSSDTAWVFVDVTTLNDAQGTTDYTFVLANYTDDGPSQSSQSAAVSGAISEWDTELGSDLELVYDGVDTSESQDPNDYVNVILFSTLEGIGAGETLLKIGTAPPNRGEILDVDILLSDDWQWSVSNFKCPESKTTDLDIRSVVTHELGHALGIAHPGSWDYTGDPSMLKAGIQTDCNCGPYRGHDDHAESLGQRSIGTDDRDALEELYGDGGSDGKSVASEEGGDSAAKPVVSAGAEEFLPRQTELGVAARPNPFNPTTRVRYSIPGESDVTVMVWSVAGQRVRTLVERSAAAPGVYSVHWDGRDEQGVEVSSGVYVVELMAGVERVTRKVTLVR